MTIQEVFYLTLVTVGFVIFSIALAYANWVDRSH